MNTVHATANQKVHPKFKIQDKKFAWIFVAVISFDLEKMFDHTDNSLSAFITTSASRPLSSHPPSSLLSFIQCVSSKHYCWNVQLHWSHLSIKCGSRVHLLRKLNLRHSLVHPLDSCVISLCIIISFEINLFTTPKVQSAFAAADQDRRPRPRVFPSLIRDILWSTPTHSLSRIYIHYSIILMNLQIFHYPFSDPILECDSEIIL